MRSGWAARLADAEEVTPGLLLVEALATVPDGAQVEAVVAIGAPGSARPSGWGMPRPVSAARQQLALFPPLRVRRQSSGPAGSPGHARPAAGGAKGILTAAAGPWRRARCQLGGQLVPPSVCPKRCTYRSAEAAPSSKQSIHLSICVCARKPKKRQK